MSAPRIFDRALVRRRLARAAAAGPAEFLLDRVAVDLRERLGAVLRDFDVAVDLGGAGWQGVEALLQGGRARTVLRLAAIPLTPRGTPLAVVEEEMPPLRPDSIDLVVSLLALQAVNDLPGALAQIRRALRPDGLLMACLLGGETLTELRQSFALAEAEVEGGASPRVAPFADARELGALLQRAGFALPVVDLDRITVRYADPLALMSDLRAMGMANPLAERARRPLRRTTLMRVAQVYGERFAAADGRVPATFDLVWLSGWAPHASQQQPLRPGSAKARLADALAVRELPAGDKGRP